ncbi:MAG: hypothetical protein V4739_18210 [Pseudomonadota bacterium]
MNVTSLNASALSPYAAPLLDQRSEDSALPLTSILATPPLDLSGIDMAALQAESQRGLNAQKAQERLDQQQAELGQALLTGLARQGTALSQRVSFSMGADGGLSVTGAPSDVDKLRSVFQRDTSQPRLQDRLRDMLDSTLALSTSVQSSNARPMAGRSAGSASNVMALYGQLTPRQEEAAATLTLSAQGSSLSYPGMFSSKA